MLLLCLRMFAVGWMDGWMGGWMMHADMLLVSRLSLASPVSETRGLIPRRTPPSSPSLRAIEVSHPSTHPYHPYHRSIQFHI
jgi:hypothetical protein